MYVHWFLRLIAICAADTVEFEDNFFDNLESNNEDRFGLSNRRRHLQVKLDLARATMLSRLHLWRVCYI